MAAGDGLDERALERVRCALVALRGRRGLAHAGRAAGLRAGRAGDQGGADVDTTWKGSAAQRYNDRLGQQEGAIKGVSEQFAETIASALTKVGAGIIVWWLSIIAAVGVLAICLTVATGAAVSILGLPAVPPAVLIGWGSFIAALIAGTGALTALCLNAKGDLEGVRSKLSGYPEGAWPAFG